MRRGVCSKQSGARGDGRFPQRQKEQIMKLRTGFVSNSSSASFVIKLADLTPEQIEAIKNATVDQKTLAPGFTIGWLDGGVEDAWDIMLSDENVSGGTVCNNDCIWDFFDRLGIPRSIVSFCDDSDGPWEDEDED